MLALRRGVRASLGLTSGLKGLKGLVGLTVALAYPFGLTACTGDDPKITFGQDGGPDSDGNGQVNGGDAGDHSPVGSDGGDGSTDPGAPALKLEADPLTITVGTSDTLRLRVVERNNVGKVTFAIGGKPEGMTVPSVAVLEADATSIDIPITADASMTHGDYTLVAKAEGQAFEASATIIVRGKPGALDTGLGNVGEDATGIEWSSDLRVAPLPDGRLIVGRMVGGQVNLYPLDVKGIAGPVVKMAAAGSLAGIAAAAADSSFVVAVKNGSTYSLVPYDAMLTEGAPQSISTFSAAPTLVGSTAGALFFQIQSGTPYDGLRIQRYTAKGVKDATFTEGFQPSDGSTSPSLNTANATLTGAAWASMGIGISQAAIVYNAATMFKGTNLSMAESCDHPAPIGEDAVFYCLNDAPTHGFRRYTNTGKIDGTFGTAGLVNFNTGTNVIDTTLSNGKDRLYFVYHLKSASGLDSISTFVGALDANGAPRTVFGTSGVAKVVGAMELPKVFVDARGRLVAWEPSFDGSETTLRLRRYWD